MKCGSLALLSACALAFLAPSWAFPGSKTTVARMKSDLSTLASEEFEGRGVGTKGLDKAAEYIKGQFTSMGLKPGGKGDSYFQPFSVPSQATLDGPAELVLKGPLGQKITLKQGADFQPFGSSGSGAIANAPLVFAGYGVNAKQAGYNDFQGLDVKGKIIVVLRRVPRWTSAEAPFDGPRKEEHATFDVKQSNAEAAGAAGVLLVNDRSEIAGGDALMPFGTTARSTFPNSVPFVHVKRSAVDPIFLSSHGQSLADVEKAIDRDLKPRSGPLAGWSATLNVKVKRESREAKNVIAVSPGKGPLAKQIVVVGAHYDHLGYGALGGSLAKNLKGTKAIHFGADDNASGTTAMLELARRFSSVKDREGRTLIFMAFSAEELGLIGSRYYTKKEPIHPLTDTVAMVNLDMVGKLRADKESNKDKLIVEGIGTSKDFEAMVDRLNPGFLLSKKKTGYGPSDHDSFTSVKVPTIFLWTGLHEDYHKPSDIWERINVDGIEKIVNYAEKIVGELSTQTNPPGYIEVPRAAMGTVKRGGNKLPRLGIRPDYSSDEEGVKLDGVEEGGPAAKAGLKEGDVITEIGGKAVRNLNGYMAVLGQQPAGQPIILTIRRNKDVLKLKVVPQ